MGMETVAESRAELREIEEAYAVKEAQARAIARGPYYVWLGGRRMLIEPRLPEPTPMTIGARGRYRWRAKNA